MQKLLESVTLPTNYTQVMVSHFIVEGNMWDFNAIDRALPESLINSIRATPLPMGGNQDDALSWSHSGTWFFSIKSSYDFITGNCRGDNDYS